MTEKQRLNNSPLANAILDCLNARLAADSDPMTSIELPDLDIQFLDVEEVRRVVLSGDSVKVEGQAHVDAGSLPPWKELTLTDYADTGSIETIETSDPFPPSSFALLHALASACAEQAPVPVAPSAHEPVQQSLHPPHAIETTPQLPLPFSDTPTESAPFGGDHDHSVSESGSNYVHKLKRATAELGLPPKYALKFLDRG
ncbi:hypothetical protein HDU93_005319 [Gonapodya sp. JEL0774]|nr:hypothetical protein HDU93_005319 [Gonapodya sp. JEL0774]